MNVVDIPNLTVLRHCEFSASLVFRSTELSDWAGSDCILTHPQPMLHSHQDLQEIYDVAAGGNPVLCCYQFATAPLHVERARAGSAFSDFLSVFLEHEHEIWWER